MEKTVREAYLLGRNGSFLDKYKDKFKSIVSSRNIEFVYQYDNSLIDLEVSRIVGEEKVSGNDASFTYKDGVLEVIPEKKGISVDYPKLISLLQNKISGDQDIYVKIPYKKRDPTASRKGSVLPKNRHLALMDRR